ncbi:MAG: hypothetical protein IVW56_10650 [Candidatus Binataceae bacterium]|nr:hypothetical protein [Candidatus Binataceae bacterium]
MLGGHHDESGRTFDMIKYWRADSRGKLQKKMACPDGIRFGTNLRGATARRLLAAFMAAARVLLMAVHRAGALPLMRRTRSRLTYGRSGGARPDAVYQEREHKND